MIRIMVLSSQTTITHDEAEISCKWLNIYLLIRSNEWIPHLALFVLTVPALPIKLSLSHETSHFYPSDSPFCFHLGTVGGCMELGCLPGLIQSKQESNTKYCLQTSDRQRLRG